MSRTRFGRIFLTFSFILSLSLSTVAADSTATAAPAADNSAASPLVAKGKQIFEDNCKSCHAIHERSVGPALAKVEGRVPGGRAHLFAWIRNSKAVLKTGDAYFTKLYTEYGNAEMTAFPTFTDEELNSVLDYIKSEENNVPVKGGQTPSGGETPGGEKTEGGSGAYDTVILALIIVVLVLVLITLTVFLNVIKKYLSDKEGKLDEEEKELLNQKFDILAVLKSRVFIGILTFIFLSVGVVACWKGLISVGVEQNYQPTQPIPYSHKLHAGDLKINCNYCHTGVYKGKQANIPSLNICMNCHNDQGVGSGPKHGTEAIATLRKAYKEGTPIQWIRVHNLPDLAYFNHSQHTNVAGLECEQCHGPIKEMEVVKQYSPLTMGWCINCHRETKVNGKDSKYYDWMLEQHAKQKKGYRPGMKIEATEAELGGLECAKCHY